MFRPFFAWACAAVLAAPAAAQYQPLSGYNVGLNPNACLCPTTYMGEFVFYMLAPGGQDLVSFHNPTDMPASTQVVEFEIIQWAIFEPRFEAKGVTQLLVTTLDPEPAIEVLPSVYYPGWTYYKRPELVLGHREFTDHSTWKLVYCYGDYMTDPCYQLEPPYPEWNIFLIRLRML